MGFFHGNRVAGIGGTDLTTLLFFFLLLVILFANCDDFDHCD